MLKVKSAEYENKKSEKAGKEFVAAPTSKIDVLKEKAKLGKEKVSGLIGNLFKKNKDKDLD